MVIYVDVDDTLVRTAGSKRIPMPAVVRHVRDLKEQGAELYCWSSGGADYARESADELGIVDCFIAFLPKPQVVLDDQEFAAWRRFLTVHPATCAGRSLEDYRNEIQRLG
jgi:phosphoglycolate phosphatase-like HAD superfamily hydrolase